MRLAADIPRRLDRRGRRQCDRRGPGRRFAGSAEGHCGGRRRRCCRCCCLDNASSGDHARQTGRSRQAAARQCDRQGAHSPAVARHARRPDAGRHGLHPRAGVRERAAAGRQPAPRVALVTQVEVDPADPAFAHPTKPVGPFFPERRPRRSPKSWRDGAGGRPARLALRRPVAQAKHICDISLAQTLMAMRTVVIVGGRRRAGRARCAGLPHGVEAVIDKDLTTAAIANVLGIPRHDDPDRRAARGDPLRQARAAGAAHRLAVADPALQAEGHFPAAAWAEGRRGDTLPRRRRPSRDHHQPPQTAMPALLGETDPHCLRRRLRRLEANGSGSVASGTPSLAAGRSGRASERRRAPPRASGRCAV